MLLQILNKEKGAKISLCKIRAKKHFCHLILLKILTALEQANRVVVFFFSPLPYREHSLALQVVSSFILFELNYLFSFPISKVHVK